MPIEILMPALSPTMTDGTLAKWLKKEGDVISSGDAICEIETDKATMEVEAVDDGVLGRIIVSAASENVPVNSVIALLLEEGEDKAALKEWKPAVVEVAVEEENIADSGESAVSAAASGGTQTIAVQATKAPTPPKVKRSGGAKASPLAKRLAEEKSVNLSNVIGTGPNGRVIKCDVELAAISSGISPNITRDEREFELIVNSGMRKVVAKRLTESKQQVPHFYLSVDCDLDKLLDIRKQLNDKAAKEAGKEGKPAYKISVNDMIIKAIALSLRDVPEANASWYDDAVAQYTNVDISVAVAIEGGLITPIVRNADQKSLAQISNEMKYLAKRARDGKLQPEEYQGGGFSISNLGMFGVKNFSAIVNPPQACILAVGGGEPQAVVRNGKIEIATVMSVTLSTDHRVVDGAVGAVFLAAFKGYIQNPALMLI